MAGPTTALGALPRDTGGRYFGHVWDASSGKGLAQRAHNVDSGNGVADSGVVLLDSAGAALLTTAAALADATVNPTAGRLGTHGLVYNGTTWDRARSDGTGTQRASLYGKSSAAGDTPVLVDASGRPIIVPLTSATSMADGLGLAVPVTTGGAAITAPVLPTLYNGATFDRARNNHAQTLIASAARTATNNSSAFASYNARAAIAYLSITAGGGGAGLQFKWLADLGTGTFPQINAAHTAITATGVYLLVLGIDATTGVGTSTAVAQLCNFPLPNSLLVQVIHDDATSFTYSVVVALLV